MFLEASEKLIARRGRRPLPLRQAQHMTNRRRVVDSPGTQTARFTPMTFAISASLPLQIVLQIRFRRRFQRDVALAEVAEENADEWFVEIDGPWTQVQVCQKVFA